MAKETDLEKRGRVIVLAERVKLLFGFCAELIPDKDLLKETASVAEDRIGTAMAMAPIIGAYGMDSEVAEFNARLHSRRAKALFELINVLDETEKERLEFKEKQKNKAQGRADIARMFGI